MGAQLLVVERDETIGSILTTSLAGAGHRVTWRRTGPAALAQAARARFDLVLLDLGQPGESGIELCRRLRAQAPDAVLIVLSVRAETLDVVLGLDAGADDFLATPVPLRRLLARVHAHLRRRPAAAPGTPPVELGDLVLDPVARRVTVAGRELSLRAKEYDLLARLAEQPGRTVSREELIADVWDPRWRGPTSTLDAYARTLRGRLTAAGGHVPSVVTVRGRGLRLDPRADPAGSRAG